MSLEISFGDPKTGAIKGGFKETFTLSLGHSETVTNTSTATIIGTVRCSHLPAVMRSSNQGVVSVYLRQSSRSMSYRYLSTSSFLCT